MNDLFERRIRAAAVVRGLVDPAVGLHLSDPGLVHLPGRCSTVPAPGSTRWGRAWTAMPCCWPRCG